MGAALDANVAALFRPFTEAAKKARQQIDTELRKAGKDGGAARVRSAEDTAAKERSIRDRALRADAQALAANLAMRKRYERETLAEAEKTANEEIRIVRRQAIQAQAERKKRLREEASDAERAQREAQRNELSFGRRTSYRSMRYFERALGAGARVASDIAGGAGIRTNIGEAVGSAVDLQRRSVELSNAAYMPGAAGAAGTRQNATELVSQAREVGSFAAMDPVKAMEGLQAFVAKTGDLETGRKILQDMAVLSRATGTSLEDMVDASGDVANALGDVDNKSEKINTVMRVIAGQGKLGAVEIKSFATQMAKVGSAATAFEGRPEDNIATLGAMVQMSRAKGGSASATQAATSVASFTNLLRTPARMKAFEGITGKKFYNQQTGMLRNPEEIIVESLKATKGDPGKFKSIFANTGGARAVEGFAATYRQAGGGEAGIAAVRAEFKKLREVAMGQGEIQESFAKSMQTADAKTQLFNNELSKVGEDIANKVLPQFQKLAPKIIDIVDALGKLAGWAAENPLEAAFTALGASIAAGAGEAVIRSGIESAIKASFVGGGGSTGGAGQFVAGPGGKSGAALSTIGSAIAITAAAVTIAEVGMLAIDKVLKGKAADDTENSLIQGMNIRAKLRGASTPEEAFAAEGEKQSYLASQGLRISAAEARKAQEQADIEQAGPGAFVAPVMQKLSGLASGAANFLTMGSVGQSFGAQDRQAADALRVDELKAEMAKVQHTLVSGTLKVQVVGGGTGVFPWPPAPTVGPSL